MQGNLDPVAVLAGTEVALDRSRANFRQSVETGVFDATRGRVLTTLGSIKVPAHWAEMVERVVEMDGGDRGELFGESLPIGLRHWGRPVSLTQAI